MKRKISDFKNKNFAFLDIEGQGLAQMLTYAVRSGDCPIACTVSG